MMLFQYLIYFLNIIFLRRWLLKKGISSNITTISSLIFMVQSLSFGFRPESLGFCFMFAGLLMLQNVQFWNFL